jgi:hypothetical protein
LVLPIDWKFFEGQRAWMCCQHYQGIILIGFLAPRPKEGATDGDLGSGDGGVDFLDALLPVLKEEGGECHWYEFCADHEFPTCERDKSIA